MKEASAETPSWLVALDMDGTLLRDDKTVAEVDARAIADARRRGVAVTLATGRLVSGALPFARELGLDTPLICADGGLIVDVASGRALHRIAIEPPLANDALATLDRHTLVPFVFLEDTIHTVPAGAPLTGLVRTWSEDVVAHPSVEAFQARCVQRPVALTVGIGREEHVLRCADDLARTHGAALETVVFAFGGEDRWAIRSLPGGCDKGVALRSLAERLGVAMERTAVVGDWLNDLGMFRAAARSFAMGQAPEEVKRAATDRLRATSANGGGIAEALAALLGR